MGYFVIGLMLGSFLFVGYKYFTETDNGCSGSCEQGKKKCNCRGKE